MIQCIYLSVSFLRKANVKGPNRLTSTQPISITPSYKEKAVVLLKKKTQPAPVSPFPHRSHPLHSLHSRPHGGTTGGLLSHQCSLSSPPLHSCDGGHHVDRATRRQPCTHNRRAVSFHLAARPRAPGE